MTEQSPIRYRRTDHPGQIYGVANTDLTEADWARITPDLRREIKASPLYEAATSEAVDLRPDPLGELTPFEFEALPPHEKGARTKEANKRAEDELATAVVEVVPANGAGAPAEGGE